MDVCVGVAKMKMQIVVDDILNLASDTIMETSSVEIDNMLCNTSLQQIPVWRRKMVNLRHYGYDGMTIPTYCFLLIQERSDTCAHQILGKV